MRFCNQKGAGALDTIGTLILIGILIGILFPYSYKITREAKEVALRGGLVNIRKSLQLYHFIERRYPADLKGLVGQRFILPAREDTFFSGEYLTGQSVNAAGDLLDPFGTPFHYDPGKGMVSSETEGYEKW